jgi:DNA-binding response OmpR family regulator/Tfp pilus assembly protein PilZ
VRREGERVVDTVTVEIVDGEGFEIRAVSQDIGTGGLFARTDAILAIGTRVEVVLHVDTPPLRIAARVVHALKAADARSLGRTAGLGLAFVDLDSEARQVIEVRVAEQDAAQRPIMGTSGELMRVVVADRETRLLGRLATALGRVGFDVATATNGVEAYAACLGGPVAVVITAIHMPVMDGMKLLGKLGSRPDLAEIPVLMMSDDAGDLRRLEAYQRGAMDFIPKPFTVVELCLRAHRLASLYAGRTQRVVLRGELSKIGLAMLLTMLEHEQKSGILSVSRGEDMAWISIRRGALVNARALRAEKRSLDTLMRVLSWSEGSFEFTACDVQSHDEISMGTTHVLLEHARLTDERHHG